MPIQKRYEPVIKQFADLVHARYPRQIEKIILYGSVARGDAKEDSDIDLLVLWKGDDREGWRAMTSIAFDVMVATGIYLSVKVMSADSFSGSPGFEKNVMQEGITIA
jgi:uncharacterized protein